MEILNIRNNSIFVYCLCFFLIIFLIELLSKLENIKRKKLIIIFLSISLIAWLDVYSLLLLIILSFSVLFLIINRINLNKNIHLITILLIVLLIIIKDYRFELNLKTPYVPLGVSYYFFRLIAIVIEYSRQPDDFRNISVLDYFTWVFFFPIFLAGPILRFQDFKELEISTIHKNRIMYYRNLILALLLKVIFVDLILYNISYVSLYNIIRYKFSPSNYHNNQFLNLPYLSIFSFFALIHAYFDLMLYTEISKGFSGILGFSNVDNFDKPFLASNISTFWQRWHMSLSSWTRDYVFFPLLVKTRKTWIATYASMLTIGIWHSATLNWIVWGFLHASAINFYGSIRKSAIYQKMSGNALCSRVLKISGIFITIYFVSIVFLFAAIHDFGYAVKLLIMCFY